MQQQHAVTGILPFSSLPPLHADAFRIPYRDPVWGRRPVRGRPLSPLIVDEWRGQAIYRPGDASGNWVRQEHLGGLILTQPESVDGRPVVGRHADVVPLAALENGKERALLVYFTHPHWGGEDIDTMADDPKTCLSHVRAAVLEVRDGNLVRTGHDPESRPLGSMTKGQTLEL